MFLKVNLNVPIVITVLVHDLMMRAIIAVLLIFKLMIISARALEDCAYDNNCANNLDFNQTTCCISEYQTLEAFVQNNETLINNLAEAFYKTGYSPAKFVRITYKFQQFSGSDDNGTNNSTNEDDIKCYHYAERVYYWSSSAIYLLGPRALFYLSLFAINVREENVIVHLPCLHSRYEKALLSRFTYLV